MLFYSLRHLLLSSRNPTQYWGMNVPKYKKQRWPPRPLVTAFPTASPFTDLNTKYKLYFRNVFCKFPKTG